MFHIEQTAVTTPTRRSLFVSRKSLASKVVYATSRMDA